MTEVTILAKHLKNNLDVTEEIRNQVKDLDDYEKVILKFTLLGLNKQMELNDLINNSLLECINEKLN